MESSSLKTQRIKNVMSMYYARKDVQKAIFDFSKNREIAPSFMMESFGKRPDSFQYQGDIFSLVKKGATSFHGSQELWKDPLEISTDHDRKQLNEIRIGWDLLFDIDSKYLDYSKVLVKIIIKILNFYCIKNIGIKFSVSGDTPILIKCDNEISLISIKEAIDLIKKGKKLEVLSLDKERKLTFSKIYDFLEHEDTLYELKHSQSTIPLKATGHHSVFVWDKGDIIQKKVTELKKRDFLVSYHSEKNPFSEKNLKITHKFELGRNQFSKEIIKKDIKITNELARLIGYFLAEGHVTNTINQVGFSFNKNEEEYINDVKNILEKITNKKISIRHPNPNSTQILVHSKEWAEFFDNFCGKKKDKHVPPFMFKSSKELFLEMLKGYIRGDGYKIGEYGVVAKSVSKRLVTEIVWLCELNGISCNMSSEKNKPHLLPQGNLFKGSLVYMLRIPKSELVDLEFNRGRNGFSPYPGSKIFPTDGLKSVYSQIRPKMFNLHRAEQMTLSKKRANLNRIRKVLDWFYKFKSVEPDKDSRKILLNYEKLFNSDMSITEIKDITKKNKALVYDVSVEGTESFFGNFYPILLHNSGSKGFHIIIPWKAFPKEINGVKTSDMFPEWPRIITQFIMSVSNNELIKEVTDLTKESQGTSKYVKDFEAPKEVIPDLVLVSPRHLFRMPYSLHEKTALASVVLNPIPEEIENFQPKDADPLKVKIKNFIPDSEEGEATELLREALDWHKNQNPEESGEIKERMEFKPAKISEISKEMIPPSIKKILEGVRDGRKRSLFIILNFFRSIGMDKEEIESRVSEWNEKNEVPLKQGYIKSQLIWSYRNKVVPPPNYDKDYYKGIGVTPTEEEFRYKNPVNYITRKSAQKKAKEIAEKKRTGRVKKKNISKNKDNFKNKD
ncbi:MAG: LAGLIDADG family homing endonuclease [Candidatus Pacearchaeota archaeon]